MKSDTVGIRLVHLNAKKHNTYERTYSTVGRRFIPYFDYDSDSVKLRNLISVCAHIQPNQSYDRASEFVASGLAIHGKLSYEIYT
jgi:hypothetical protein